jgi:hypothetical protein
VSIDDVSGGASAATGIFRLEAALGSDVAAGMDATTAATAVDAILASLRTKTELATKLDTSAVLVAASRAHVLPSILRSVRVRLVAEAAKSIGGGHVWRHSPVAQELIQLLHTLVREAPPLGECAGSRHTPQVDGGNAAAGDSGDIGDGGDAGSTLADTIVELVSDLVSHAAGPPDTDGLSVAEARVEWVATSDRGRAVLPVVVELLNWIQPSSCSQSNANNVSATAGDGHADGGTDGSIGVVGGDSGACKDSGSTTTASVTSACVSTTKITAIGELAASASVAQQRWIRLELVEPLCPRLLVACGPLTQTQPWTSVTGRELAREVVGWTHNRAGTGTGRGSNSGAGVRSKPMVADAKVQSRGLATWLSQAICLLRPKLEHHTSAQHALVWLVGALLYPDLGPHVREVVPSLLKLIDNSSVTARVLGLEGQCNFSSDFTCFISA